MGIFDKAKDALDVSKAKEGLDKAQQMVSEHGDKLPGGAGEKAADMIDKAKDGLGKVPGADAAGDAASAATDAASDAASGAADAAGDAASGAADAVRGE